MLHFVLHTCKFWAFQASDFFTFHTLLSLKNLTVFLTSQYASVSVCNFWSHLSVSETMPLSRSSQTISFTLVNSWGFCALIAGAHKFRAGQLWVIIRFFTNPAAVWYYARAARCVSFNRLESVARYACHDSSMYKFAVSVKADTIAALRDCVPFKKIC